MSDEKRKARDKRYRTGERYRQISQTPEFKAEAAARQKAWRNSPAGKAWKAKRKAERARWREACLQTLREIGWY